MKPTQLKPADAWTELIFAHRNKQYGAYTLRRDYDKRMLQSLLITISSMLLLFLVFRMFNNTEKITTLPVINDPFNKLVDPTLRIDHHKTKTTLPSRSSNSLNAHLITRDIDSSQTKIDTSSNTGANSNNNLKSDSSSASGSGGRNIKSDTTSNTNQVVLFPETMPEFPGGYEAMMRYLQNHIDCPLWMQNGESGKVMLSLVIDAKGNVTHVNVLRDGVGYGCAEQVLQVVKNMPRWKPGRIGDQTVSVKYILPISYERR
jgi:periplasmic protein TonB